MLLTRPKGGDKLKMNLKFSHCKAVFSNILALLFFCIFAVFRANNPAFPPANI